jgi:sugar phosphate isomerase/epimerase
MTNRKLRAGVLDSVVGGSDDRSTFQRARWAGFAGVEATLSARDLKGEGGDRLRALQRASASSGLAVASFVLDHHNLGGIADADPRVAAGAAEEVRLAIGWAAELGARTILVPFFGHAELLTESDRVRAVSAFRALCPLASGGGISLLYEGPLPAGEVARLAQEIGSPAFGCYFDTANLVFRGLDPPTEIRRLATLVRQVHIKDVRARKGDVHLGRGRVDFAECARALAEIGYEGWLVFETPPGPPPLAARDLSYVRSVFGDIEAGDAWPVYGAHVEAPLEEAAGVVASAGITAVLLGGEALDAALADTASTRRLLAKAGLRLAALAPAASIVARDDEVREAAVAAVERCLEAAPGLGTWVVSTGTGTLTAEGGDLDSREWASEEAWATLCSSVARLLPAAEQRDVVLALEGSARTVLKTPSQVLQLLERYPSPSLQVVADPYAYLSPHLLSAHERVSREFLELLEDRFVLARLDDVSASNSTLERPEFGLGEFSQRPYLAFLRERRPDLPLIFERLPAGGAPQALARVSAPTDAG